LGAELFDTINLKEQLPVPVAHDLMDRLLPPLPFEATIRVRFVGDIVRVTSLRVVYSRFSRLSSEALMSFLRNYAPADVVEKVVRIVDPRGLASALSYIEMIFGEFYGRPRLSYMIDEESEEPFIAVVVIPNCDWDAWGHIARMVKDEMRRAGLGEVASKVAIVCLEGLRGPPP